MRVQGKDAEDRDQERSLPLQTYMRLRFQVAGLIADTSRDRVSVTISCRSDFQLQHHWLSLSTLLRFGRNSSLVDEQSRGRPSPRCRLSDRRTSCGGPLLKDRPTIHADVRPLVSRVMSGANGSRSPT